MSRRPRSSPQPEWLWIRLGKYAKDAANRLGKDQVECADGWPQRKISGHLVLDQNTTDGALLGHIEQLRRFIRNSPSDVEGIVECALHVGRLQRDQESEDRNLAIKDNPKLIMFESVSFTFSKLLDQGLSKTEAKMHLAKEYGVSTKTIARWIAASARAPFLTRIYERKG